MGLLRKFFNQTRKPEGFLGKIMVSTMNSGHRKNADWGISQLRIRDPRKILDVGCGGGGNLAELGKIFPGAVLYGIDYSDISVEASKKYNQKAIEKGKCFVSQGDVSSLSFENDSFDLVTAFETVYFWPGLEKCFREVHRVLKEGGVFLVVNESDGTDKTSKDFEKIIDGMKNYTAEEIETALKKAGFKTAKSFHHEKKPWIAVEAKK